MGTCPGASAPTSSAARALYYLNFNRNKRSVTLDLRTPRGQEVMHRLVAVSDVVFDAFRPSVLERLGLDYETLKAINPSIIACSLSAFGQEGPYRERPGFDGIVQAMGGGMSVTGNPGQPPVFMGFPVGDMVGGYMAALSIASALYGRRVTGEGRRLDISLLDVQIALQAHLGQFYLVIRRGAAAHRVGAPLEPARRRLPVRRRQVRSGALRQPGIRHEDPAHDVWARLRRCGAWTRTTVSQRHRHASPTARRWRRP